MRQEFKKFSEQEHDTWRRLFEGQSPLRERQLVDLFPAGLERLGIRGERVPELDEVNRRLAALTGFSGVAVEGLEGPASFFRLLARREFPIGNFIRDPSDLAYTPAPDVFHDLYGHLPFLADSRYATFCQQIGQLACKTLEDPESLRQWDRFFWFTLEFALVRTPQGTRIFGAGIASSRTECAHALSGAPEVVPFDLEKIRHQEFRIDEFQKKLFLLESPEQLYGCLPSFEAGLAANRI